MTEAAPVLDLADAAVGWPARPGGRPGFALRIPRLTLAAGGRMALLGASGGGKSTLLALLAGAAAPLPGSGPVRVCDADMRRLSGAARDRHRADRIGLVFQLFNLLPAASVRDNILLPLDFSRRRRARVADPAAEAARLMAALGLPGELAAAPAGALSVGQQQRVAAARALIGAPELVLADEPTSALDPASRERFLDLLFAEADRAGAAVLLVTHDAATAARFETRLALEDIAEAAR